VTAGPTIHKALTVSCFLSFDHSVSNCNFAPVKKLFAILMIMLYGLSATGATVQLHYCCGKLKSMQLGTAPVKECGSKHKMGTKPCCETKHISAKSHDQQDVYTICLAPKAPVEANLYFAEPRQPVAQSPAIDERLADHSSPPLSNSLFILYRVFRI
jgi:hypothetical protein